MSVTFSTESQQTLQQLTILSAQDKSTHNRVNTIHTTIQHNNKSVPSVQRIYDSSVHGFVYELLGDSHSTKLVLPKTQQSLNCIHPYLLLQIYLTQQLCYIEIIVQDKLKHKKRIIFSGTHSNIQATQQYTIYPLSNIQSNIWNNCVLNLHDLSTYEYSFEYYCIVSISIGAQCKLRRIATLNYTPFDTSNDLIKYNIQSYNTQQDTEHIHKDIQYPIGVDYTTQVIDIHKIHAYIQYNNIQSQPSSKYNSPTKHKLTHNHSRRPSTASSTTSQTHNRHSTAQSQHIDRLAKHRQHAAEIAQQNAVASIFSTASESLPTTPFKAKPIPKHVIDTVKRTKKPPVSKSAYIHAASKRIDQLAQPRKNQHIDAPRRDSMTSQIYDDNGTRISIDNTLRHSNSNLSQRHHDRIKTPQSQHKRIQDEQKQQYDSDTEPMSPIVITHQHKQTTTRKSYTKHSEPNSPVSHATFSSPKLAHTFVQPHMNNISHRLAEIRFTPDKPNRRLEYNSTQQPHIDQVNLQFDPILECYFDPVTATYYKLK